MDSQQIEFRPLAEADLSALHTWLNRPHVVEWWKGEPSLDEVRAKYLTRIAAGPVRPYIAHVGSEPIGYIQSYAAIESDGGWWTGYSDRGVLGIDLFIAEHGRLGQGLGTAMVSQFASFLFNDPVISRIQVDPHPDNLRAIRCYEKAGFHAQRVVSTPHGSALLMILDRLD
jgi:aminoglycoside 6'-N-acetyltransferase-1b/aminoglycoside 6'-N-acetyltransferase-2